MWSKTKKGLNDRLAYSLRNRVSYQFEVFRTNAGNKTKMRVFSIVADGKIIFVSNPKARAVECDFVNEQTEKLQKQYRKNPTSKETIHKNKPDGHWKQAKKSPYH